MNAVFNHLRQTTLFAAAIGLVALALRQNSAATRYWLWLVASVKFLVPFSVLVTAGGLLEWRTAPPVASAVSIAVEQVGQPFTPLVVESATQTAPAIWPAVLVAIWLCGFAGTLTFWWTRWHRVRSALRAATPFPLDAPIRVLSSPTLLEPGVVGIFRPVLLLPAGIVDWLAPEQLHAILAHELCHVRRRDNLAAAVHMVIEALFWFHPMVWWIGARLVEERERACDEEVLARGHAPEHYAEGIVSVCKFYRESALLCSSGVTGADLKKRITAIMTQRMAMRLTPARMLLLAVAATIAVAGPILIGVVHAQSETGKLTFEVASIRRLDPNAQAGGAIPLAPGVTPDGGIRSQVSIFRLICWAYRIDANQLSGGPSWIRSDRYAIEAKPGPEESAARLSQQERDARTRERVKALLADRFQLAVRAETKEAQVYVLSVAKGGHKLTPDAEGRSGVRYLGDAIESMGAPISFLAVPLTQMLGRPVLDETGLDGRFKYRLEFRPEDDARRAFAAAGQPVADDDPRPSVFTAIKSQLGLELQSRKGPVTAVVIEKIEKPSEN